MSKRKIKNPRAQLSIAAPVLERLRWEADFLNLNSRITPPPSDGPQSRGDIIRRAVDLFVDWCDGGGVHECDYPERDSCSFYFRPGEMGRWDYAVGQHYASSYHDLATLALDWYFGRLDEQERCDRATYAALKEIPLSNLETLLKAGALNDVLQTAQSTL